MADFSNVTDQQSPSPQPARPRPRRSFLAIALGQTLIVGALMAGVLASLVAAGWVDLPYRYNPFAPLDLRQPPDRLTSFRLRRTARDIDMCVSTLRAADIAVTRVPDDIQANGCGWREAVFVSPAGTSLSGPITTTCTIMTSFALFERYGVQPAARRHFGRDVARIEHLGTYACRPIAGRSRLSQHASANAIDISAFVLEGGGRISLVGDWDGSGPQAAFLREVRDEACRWFNVVLGPDYNSAHADHFHFDNGPARICR